MKGVVTLAETGKPAAGAEVWLSQEAGVQKTKAKSDGAFRLSARDAGAFHLVAALDGYALDGYTGFLAGDAEIDLALPKGEPVTVQVIGPTSQPLSGARLTWLNINGNFNVPVAALNEADFPQYRSDGEGKLTLPLLPSGGFVRLRLTQFEHADLMVDYLPVREKQPALQMLSGQRVGGRVLSPDDKGVAGAKVSVFQVGVSGQREFASAVSDPEGYFHCRVPAGDYRVSVRHADFASPEPVDVGVHGENDAEAILKLETPRRIEGAVELPDGKPCGGAYIAYLKGDTLYEETFTGADGAFHLRVASPDGVLRIIPPAGFVTQELAEIPVAMEEATRVTLKPIQLREIPRLSGLVRDTDGKPLPNAIITTPRIPDPERILTGPDGRFSYVPSFLPEGGAVYFQVEHPIRFEKGSFEASFTKSEDVEVKLTAYPPRPPATPEGEAAPEGPLVGAKAPALSTTTWFNGDALTLDALKGKVVVLAFWASFDDSPQGRDAVDQLAILQQAYAGDEQVAIVGLHDATSTEEEVRAFLSANGLTLPVGLDSQRFETFTAYKVTYIPDFLLIGKDGVIRFRQPGDALVEDLKLLRRE